MSRRQVVILVAAALIVVAAVILGVLSTGDGGVISPGDKDREGAQEVTETGPDGVEVPVFSSAVPEDVELTEPVNEAPAAPGVEEKDRSFKITISENGFSPSRVNVNVGDVIRINFTAQGGDYDVQIPYTGHYLKISDGETKDLSLGVNTAGTYAFMCRDFCPGKTITGQLIVLPK